MKHIRQHRYGGPEVLVLEEVPDLVPAEGQVRIAVEVAGVHLVDTSIRAGRGGPPGSPTPPTTPGREVAGVVDAVGPDVDHGWTGRRVVAHLGAVGGGYAEQAVTHVERLHALPDDLAADVAVAAIGTGRTAAGILDLAPLAREDRVVVTAASGGLGTVLLRAAAGVGARAVGLANGPAKTTFAAETSDAPVVDHTRDGWEERLVAALGGAPTVVLDGVGGEQARSLHALLGDAGVQVIYTGATADDFPPGAEVRPVLGPALTARPGGLRSLEEEALARAVDGSRVPRVGSRFDLADASSAHRGLEARRTVGKVVLVTARGRSRA